VRLGMEVEMIQSLISLSCFNESKVCQTVLVCLFKGLKEDAKKPEQKCAKISRGRGILAFR